MKKVHFSSLDQQIVFGIQWTFLYKFPTFTFLRVIAMLLFCFFTWLKLPLSVKWLQCNLVFFLCLAKDCLALYQTGQTCSGVYTIYPTGGAKTDVVCDMKIMGGGWTVRISFTKTTNHNIDLGLFFCRFAVDTKMNNKAAIVRRQRNTYTE